MTDRTCSVDDCEKLVVARGWCSTHYARWRRNGTVEAQTPQIKSPCAFPECEKVSKTRGWCVTHYSRWLRHGTVDDPQPRSVDVCSVDSCDRPARTRGWCDKHYLRWHRHGSTSDPIPRCSVADCDRRVLSNNLCPKHRWRQKTHGSFDLPGANPPFGTKWCRKCKTYQPLAEFYVSKKGPESPCKACRSKYERARRKLSPPRTRSSKNSRRRALLQVAQSEPYTALEIAERDGWRCQICRKRIGHTLRFPHPRSLSIDHIVPLSRGGDDVKSNVQATHLRCNLSKQTRGSDQLRLIG